MTSSAAHIIRCLVSALFLSAVVVGCGQTPAQSGPAPGTLTPDDPTDPTDEEPADDPGDAPPDPSDEEPPDEEEPLPDDEEPLPDEDDPLLSPVKPGCENLQGDADDCWEEWLKEVGTVDFESVERGALGPGPWPVVDFEHLGASVGIDERIVGVGVDTGQNQYAVSRDALFIRRAGETQFAKYRRGTNGIRDYPLASVAGGGPGQAYIGLVGIGDQEDDPVELRKSGDVQSITLEPGGFSTVVWDTHNSNSPISGKYDHSRQIYEIQIPRRGPAAGEIFLGTAHGVVRYQGERYADHRHIETTIEGSKRYGNVKALTVTDDGTFWYGSEYAFGGARWSPRLYEWYFETPWLFPTRVFGVPNERAYYEGIGVDSTGRNVWVVGRTHGMAHLAISENGRRAEVQTMSVPDSLTTDLVVDTNDTLWVGADSGLFHYDPGSKAWRKVNEVPSGVVDLFLDDTVSPRALYIGHRNGVTVYRGP